MSNFFPPRPATTPTIYAFASTHPDHAGLLKVGYTERIAGRFGLIGNKAALNKDQMGAQV